MIQRGLFRLLFCCLRLLLLRLFLSLFFVFCRKEIIFNILLALQNLNIFLLPFTFIYYSCNILRLFHWFCFLYLLRLQFLTVIDQQ